tara:strand:+ start:1965 stop:2150 length:186 start_codon:yes stop_codon:yes gene_type:complete
MSFENFLNIEAANILPIIAEKIIEKRVIASTLILDIKIKAIIKTGIEVATFKVPGMNLFST